MNTPPKSIDRYDAHRAAGYDQQSQLDKGSRDWHRTILKDVLAFLPFRPGTFIDLGCGTGYFSRVFFETYPGIHGTLLDGSADMLGHTREGLEGLAVDAEHRVMLFQEVLTQGLTGPYDLIFSALAIHHLEDPQKWALFEVLYGALSPGGAFILYDIFRVENARGQQLLEFLACKDMQRRLMEELGVDESMEIEELSTGRIIENDRRVRQAEGDQEARLDQILAHLEAAGFRDVTLFLQEARFAGIICFKH